MGGDEQPSTMAAQTISPAQDQMLDKASQVLLPLMDQPDNAIPFDTFAGADDLFTQAFEQFKTSFNDPTQTDYITQNLQNIIEGKGTYQADVAGVAKEFNQNITTPVTQILKDTLGVDTQNALNQPGRLFASDLKSNVSKAISQELGTTTAPLLAQTMEAERQRGFTSNENFLSRQQGAISALQSLPSIQAQQGMQIAEQEQQQRQSAINADVTAFMRSQVVNNTALQLALGIATNPTQDTIAYGGGNTALGTGIGALAGLASGGGMLSIAGGSMLGGMFG